MPEQQLYLGTSQLAASYLGTVASTIYDKATAPTPALTSGYKIFVDANNPTSYPGTGTIWYDLSVNLNDATLINGPTFNSGTPDYFSFDGTNDYGIFPYASSGSDLDDFTFGGWINFNTSLYKAMVFRGQDDGSGGWSAAIGVSTAANGTKIEANVVTIVPGAIQSTILGSTTLSNNTWYHIYAVWKNGVSLKVYLNGVLDGTFNTSRNQLRNNSATGWVLNKIGSSYFPVKIGEFDLYFKELNSTEILNNFNATKTNYGY
jgi:hypothetical protein